MATPVKPPARVPYYKQPNRNRTPPEVAMACMKKGWSWKGKKYSTREEWISAVKGGK